MSLPRHEPVDVADLIELGQRALRRLAFVDLRLAQLEADCQQLSAAASEAPTSEIQSLLRQLSDAQAELRLQQREAFEALSSRIERLSRQFPEWLEEIRGRQASEKPGGKPVSQSLAAWEEAKRRLLDSWESDSGGQPPDEENAESRSGREHDTENVQELLKAKDSEIAALKVKLAEYEERLKVIDENELIRQERERLIELQRAWEAKLREAEVEISIERAKLARERAELEEKLRSLESSGVQPGATGSSAPRKSRWLAQLGLSD